MLADNAYSCLLFLGPLADFEHAVSLTRARNNRVFAHPPLRDPGRSCEVMLHFDWYEYGGALATSQLNLDAPASIADLEFEFALATE